MHRINRALLDSIPSNSKGKQVTWLMSIIQAQGTEAKWQTKLKSRLCYKPNIGVARNTRVTGQDSMQTKAKMYCFVYTQYNGLNPGPHAG